MKSLDNRGEAASVFIKEVTFIHYLWVITIGIPTSVQTHGLFLKNIIPFLKKQSNTHLKGEYRLDII